MARNKSSVKSSEREMVPQPHGGALLPGAGGGVQPGAGRPPSEIRKRLRGSFEERIKILEDIADDTNCSPADRCKALDMLAKYGLGTKQEITGPDDAPLFKVYEKTDEFDPDDA